MKLHGILGNPEFWLLVSFILFFVLFGRRIWSAIARILDARAQAVRTELAEAARLRAEAERMQQEATRALEAARAESADILARSRAEAENVAAHARTEAETAARRRERLAADRIAAAEKAAIAEIQSLAAEFAVEGARRVLSSGLGEDTGTRLIEDSIARVPQAFRAERA